MKSEKPELTQTERDRWAEFDALTDDEIDTTDIPETTDWSGAVRGLFHMSPDERRKAMEKLRSRRPKDTPFGDWTRYEWAPPTGYVGVYISEETKNTLNAYRSQPHLVRRDAKQEEYNARGGYARRQLFELAQNSADALSGSKGGRILIRLTRHHLYCADEGRPIDKPGVTALMFAYLSSKRGTDEIGRFGLGFKSVLRVTDAPEFFSRSGSFRFDRERTARLVKNIAPDAESYPVLSLPETIDPDSEMEHDPILRGLMGWASNIVRLPLKEGAHENLESQIEHFPAAFLLFVEHVSELTLQNDNRGTVRTFSLSRQDGLRFLNDGENTTRWMVVKSTHELSSEAREDNIRPETVEVPIYWAAPLDRLNDPGEFWAFFPTVTTSLLAGILNAPWKTNEDRQNLLPGAYNDELIDAAANMVADALPQLSTSEDPARHLDALPRRYEFNDNKHSVHLRNRLSSILRNRNIAPDQKGVLRKITEISYPPDSLTDNALRRWEEYDNRPLNWIHLRALTRNRLARLESMSSSYWNSNSIPRTTIAEWLEALFETATSEQEEIQASITAIKIAGLISESVRRSNNLGRIVLTSDRRQVELIPDYVFLGGEYSSNVNKLVHPQLQADPDTLSVLESFGIKPVSSATLLRNLASALLGYNRYRDETQVGQQWHEFWRLARNIDQSAAIRIIKGHYNWSDSLRVRTVGRRWLPLLNVLLPGPVVPEDGSRDADIAIDVQFHQDDLTLLKELGVVDTPCGKRELSTSSYREFKRLCENKFYENELQHTPQSHRLVFKSNTTSGPLDQFGNLSEEGKVLYTEALLNLPDTYKKWTMFHDIIQSCSCPKLAFKSPAIQKLREHGRVRVDGEIRSLSEIIRAPTRNFTALYELFQHPKADLISDAFGIDFQAIQQVESVGEDAAIPLLDIWPGLILYIPTHRRNLSLVRCDGFRQFGQILNADELACVVRDGTVYVLRSDDERDDLRLILREIGLPSILELQANYPDRQIENILQYRTPEEIQAARDNVRIRLTDAERLLTAVGETSLRQRLPQGLISILEVENGGFLTGVQIAQAAISTFHTDALHEYRHAIGHLSPPHQWAGGAQAVEFVRSLGFEKEWAGEKNSHPDPYIEVEGPYSLPQLHSYQENIVDRVRHLIRSDAVNGGRRGMISMPTGSGKTRVAVQSIVEAMKDDGFEGGVLWVADRSELCEQAVESWRQVWASAGVQGAQLRISRMWGGQPAPLPTAQMHVIVATIQTLSSKIGDYGYEFLSDFKLLVFDEAHRTLAPSFTSVMQELGFTRLRRVPEPILIGLTATPYRGYSESETTWLVNRYGQNRLDANAFKSDGPEAVIGELQDMRVLARADHDTIEGGSFLLSDLEARQASETPWLPQSIENQIAGDTERTRRIVKAYRDKIAPDAPTLIFATSVEHSKILAALLTSKGVNARAVSADTDTSTRRRIVEQFRAGEIKVLVNYGIFREGFDAPKTRAIIVARPVYSPNLYFQMIGRGLRGVKNGGNDRCLILNVEDNIENFERKLAFSELDWLWD